jgi:hypothetical protein
MRKMVFKILIALWWFVGDLSTMGVNKVLPMAQGSACALCWDGSEVAERSRTRPRRPHTGHLLCREHANLGAARVAGKQHRAWVDHRRQPGVARAGVDALPKV